MAQKICVRFVVRSIPMHLFFLSAEEICAVGKLLERKGKQGICAVGKLLERKGKEESVR